MPFFSRKKLPTQQPGPICTWSAHALQPGSSPSPFPRDSHTLTTTATAAGKLFLFGGYVYGSTSNDLYVFSTRDFTATLLQTSGDVPTPRQAHGAALIDTTLLIHGGSNTDSSDQNALNYDSLCLLNIESREWTRIVTNGWAPSSRVYHTTAVIGSKLFVFGGQIGGDCYNDIWTLDLNRLKSQPVWESYEPAPGSEKPLSRTGHVSVTTEDRIIIFGGGSAQGDYNDTWSFDISTRKWTKLQCTGSIPSPRKYHAAVLIDDIMYVFGGLTGRTKLDDLYALRLSMQRWFKCQNVGPSPHKRAYHAMGSDGTRVFVLGGLSKGARADENSLIHVFDTKYIKYPEPVLNAINPNEKTTELVGMSSTDPPTQGQPQDPKSSLPEAHSASRLQSAAPTVSRSHSSLQITHERNPSPNGRPLELTGVNSKPRRVPDDNVSEGSTEYDANFVAAHSSEGNIARLEPERQPSVSFPVQTERDQRMAQPTDELALKSALLEQAEANAAEAAKRAGLHADRLLVQTSLVEQRDAELVDLQARFSKLVLSHDQQEAALQDLRSQFSDSQTTVLRLEIESKRHKKEAERLKGGMDELKANHETAIAQARKQAADLQRDKSYLQQSLSTLKAEMARSNHQLPRMGSSTTPEATERSDRLTPNDRETDDVLGLAPSTSRRHGDTSATFAADGDSNFDSSVDASPSRPFQAPNHPSNKIESLQQYEKGLTNARAKLEAKESELEAVRSRLTDAENGWAKSDAGADTLRAQTATDSVNRDEDQITRRLMERVRALEAEMVSKRWNEKSIEEMECRNEE